MGKQKEYGICHICGKHEKLSREHIPPQATFNSQNQKLCSVDTLLKAQTRNNLPPWDISGLRYKPFQSGVWLDTLCETCNSFTGSKYGREYSKIVQGIGYEVLKIPKEKRKGALSFHIQNVDLLAFFKQVVSMFCSVNTPEFGENFRDFLLDESNKDFDCERYRVFAYLHAGKVVRYVPFQGQLNIKTGSASFFSEISTFPLGFIFYNLMEQQKETFYGCDITPFATYDFGDLKEIELPLPFLTCNTPFGLDFRDL